MKIATITKDAWPNAMEKLSKACRLYGPVKKEQFHSFEVLDNGQIPDFNFQNTRISPKFLVQPQSEIMFQCTFDQNREDHHILKEIPKSDSPRTVIGIRPCDADAFLLVKRNFNSQKYKDPFWMGAYESLTLVGLACHQPCTTCFCTSAGSGPFSETGLDILMVDDGDRYLAKIITSKGEDIAAAAGWTEAPEERGLLEKIGEMKEASEKKITTSVATEHLKNKSTIPLYEAAFWEDVSFSCINCGTCTYVCPTCWCFDIQDECFGLTGIRMRNWDSCMYPLFTLHGSGHNPRGTKLHRVRQRFMHKLKYYVDKYNNGIQCVGCGRCISQCPVNIDIRRVCELMNASETP
ncbi:MAG: 4Fe-4S dicluster domain-containing protein [Thermodesulfobacteriota bacterium]